MAGADVCDILYSQRQKLENYYWLGKKIQNVVRWCSSMKRKRANKIRGG
jgi:hypothetical protein